MAPRALTSATLASIFSSTGVRVATPMTTVPGSTRAMGPCLSSPAGEALGPQVGELLQLEGALEGHRVADVAAEEEERRRVAVAARPPRPRHRTARGRWPPCRGGRPWRRAGAGRRRRSQGAADLTQVEGEDLEGGDLGQVGLGGGHTDFRAGPGVEHGVASRAIDESTTLEMTSTLAPRRRASRMASHGVGRLPGLAHPDDQGAFVEDRVAVAELAGDVDLHRQPGPVLDGVLGHQPGVVAAAAGHDEHLVEGPELVVA